MKTFMLQHAEHAISQNSNDASSSILEDEKIDDNDDYDDEW